MAFDYAARDYNSVMFRTRRRAALLAIPFFLIAAVLGLLAEHQFDTASHHAAVDGRASSAWFSQKSARLEASYKPTTAQITVQSLQRHGGSTLADDGNYVDAVTSVLAVDGKSIEVTNDVQCAPAGATGKSITVYTSTLYADAPLLASTDASCEAATFKKWRASSGGHAEFYKDAPLPHSDTPLPVGVVYCLWSAVMFFIGAFALFIASEWNAERAIWDRQTRHQNLLQADRASSAQATT